MLCDLQQIKIRAGGCWLDYTCMDYHYETQPNPSPISWIMHNNPHWFHVLEVGANHFAELIAPWFLLIPIRKVSITASLIQVSSMVPFVFYQVIFALNILGVFPNPHHHQR